MSGLIDFFAGVTGEAVKRNDEKRQDDRELEMMKRKQQMAMKLEAQLAEQRRQLAQKYPTYSHFVMNPNTGDVIGMSDTGQGKVAYESDPATKEALLQSKKAEAAKRNADAQQSNAQTDYYQSGAALNRAKAEDPSRFRNSPQPKRAANELDPNAYRKGYMDFLKSIGTSDINGSKPAPDTEANRVKYKEQVTGLGLLGPGVTAGAVTKPTSGLDAAIDMLQSRLQKQTEQSGGIDGGMLDMGR